MLHTNPQDRKSIETKVTEVLTQGKGKKFIFVYARDFYRSMHFSKLRSNQFAAEISDFLCGTRICNLFGHWVFTEYGDGLWVFCRIHCESGSAPQVVDRLVEEGLALNLTHFSADTPCSSDEDEITASFVDATDDKEKSIRVARKPDISN